MINPISRISLCRNGLIGSRKTRCRIPKGSIHVQATFNNTIVTVTDMPGRVVSWSSASTSRFKGAKRGTPFTTQSAMVNAIYFVVDQGMQRSNGKRCLFQTRCNITSYSSKWDTFKFGMRCNSYAT